MIGEINLNQALTVLPRLYLCTPNRTTVAELKEAFNLSLKPTLAGIHELDFTIPCVIEQNKQIIQNPHVNLLKGHYLIRYEQGTDKEYFLITKPKKSMGTDGKEIYSVVCFLQPYELRGKIIRSYTGTKKLYDATTKDGVLNETLMQKTDWTVGHIDDSLASKYRTFNVSQKSMIDFMNELADTFDAVIIWDSVNKTINFYETANVGTDKGLSIECGKYLKSLDEEPVFDNVVTRLYAYGQNGLTIASVNPSGSEFIEMYDYYMNPFLQQKNISSTKLRSGNIDAWSLTNTTQILSDINTLKLNCVTVPIKINVTDASTSTMTVDETDKANAITLIQQLNSLGVKVILEPYPNIANGTIPETSWNPTDVNGWFYNWKTIILHELITDVAIPYSVYGLYIASNLADLESNTGYWNDVITYVRGLYNGKVIYRTNWWVTATWDSTTTTAYQNKLNNGLFGNVDVIAISAYFELNQDTVTTVDQLVTDIHSTRIYNRGQNVYQEVKNFNDKWNKPIFFGELGFPSKELASEQPWNPTPSTNDSQLAQANLFQAYREVFEGETWLQGFSVFSIGNITSNYYPIGKLAQIQVKKWYQTQLNTILTSSTYMTNELCQSILDYEDLLTANQTNFSNLLTSLTNYQTTLTSQQNTLNQYLTDISVIQDNLDTANATGQPTDQLITQRTAKQAQIDSQNALIATTQTSITNVTNQMNTLRSVIAVENNFTSDEIIERDYFSIEQVWSDTNYTDVNDLYNQAVTNLQKLSQPLVQYSIDLVDFTKVVQCSYDWGKLNLGDIVTIKYPNFGIDIKAKIITIDHNFDGNDIKLTIANTTDLKQGFYQLKDLLNRAAYSSTTLDMSQYKYEQAASTSSTINDIINNTWSANLRKINGGNDNSVEISNRGLLIKSNSDPNTYLIGKSGILAITKDNGASWRNAITGDGCVKEKINIKVFKRELI